VTLNRCIARPDDIYRHACDLLRPFDLSVGEFPPIRLLGIRLSTLSEVGTAAAVGGVAAEQKRLDAFFARSPNKMGAGAVSVAPTMTATPAVADLAGAAAGCGGRSLLSTAPSPLMSTVPAAPRVQNTAADPIDMTADDDEMDPVQVSQGDECVLSQYVMKLTTLVALVQIFYNRSIVIGPD
jgi:hypothetical protein